MNISAHGKYPVRHKNMWHGGRMITALTPQKIYKQMAREGMITAKGVRAGINPAPTHHFKRRLGSETIPRNSVSRVTP